MRALTQGGEVAGSNPTPYNNLLLPVLKSRVGWGGGSVSHPLGDRKLIHHPGAEAQCPTLLWVTGS